MNFRSWQLEQERLPWSWPLRLGPSVPLQRARAIITAIDDTGFMHQAELAPCPGVHPETLDEALGCWHDFALGFLKQDPAWQKWSWTEPFFGLLDLPELPMRSVQTACEQLLLSLAQSKNPSEFCLPAPMSIEGSALLPCRDGSWDDFLELWQQGFRVYKCKLGRTPAADEYAFLQKIIRYSGGQLRLRLDANRGMNAADLAFWRQRSAELPLDYWEEAAGLEPGALDESLWDEAAVPIEGSRWILKPTRLGLARTVKLLSQAAAHNISCVLSNSFDSALTLRSAAWLYAAFCKNPQPLGYGTTRFLPPDRWQSERWGAALVTIPRHPFAWPQEDL